MIESNLLQAGQIMVGFAGWEFIKFGVNKFLKKSVGTAYLTESKCKDCKSETEIEKKSVRAEISVIRRILFLLAMKNGISNEEIVKLVEE